MDRLEAPVCAEDVRAEKARIAELRRQMVAIRHQQILLAATQAAVRPFSVHDVSLCRAALDAHHMVRAIDDDTDDL